MWEKLRVVFTISELRNKILLTLGLLAVYRLGYHVPLPFVDPARSLENQGGMYGLMQHVATFSASRLNQATIFGLGIMPYISASIIFQLLASVWEPLERLKKEGESGQKKINEYTRYATVFICILQSWIYVQSQIPLVHRDFWVADTPSLSFGWQLAAVLTMTAGSVFLMWLGEQIDEFGIGNGISLLIMAGILAQIPGSVFQSILKPVLEAGQLSLTGEGSAMGVDKLLVLSVLFVAVVAAVVFITLGQRQIPTQSAKQHRGRRVYGGTRQFLPLRVNTSGVMPIIFASSLLMFPALFFSFLSTAFPGSMIWRGLNDAFQRGTGFTYNVLYVAMIFFFCYFWTAIVFNPKEMANQLKDMGSFIPGYRPGRRTADYLERVMVRITYVGAGFLAAVAITPTIISGLMGVDPNLASFYGGTGLLIAVSVAFDLVQKIDSHLVMRNYKGLLEKG